MKGKLSLSSSVRSSRYSIGIIVLLLYVCLPGGQTHISSLIGSGDLIPPRLNQIRVSRGPTVSPTGTEDAEDETSHIPFPSFQHNKFLRRLTHHSRNPAYATMEGSDGDENSPEDKGMKDNPHDDNEEEMPTFTPFISARALSNIPKFFEHLRENLHALQAEDDYNNQEREMKQPDRRGDPSEEDYQSSGNYVYSEYQPERTINVKPRWQPPASGHTHNIRSFIQPPTEQESYLRRANNYNPSWLYTNLGLGKRRR